MLESVNVQGLWHPDQSDAWGLPKDHGGMQGSLQLTMAALKSPRVLAWCNLGSVLFSPGRL